MTNTASQDIVIRLDSIDQLFNAPDINPFSDEEVDVLGEPALLRAVRRLLAQRIRNWNGKRLVLELPADQITPGLEQETEQALRRYSQAAKDRRVASLAGPVAPPAAAWILGRHDVVDHELRRPLESPVALSRRVISLISSRAPHST